MDEQESKQLHFQNLLTYLANLVILNLLFLICSIPLLTIGASASALFSMVRKMNEGEEIVFRGFFKALKKQFLQASLSWIIILTPLVLIVFEFYMLQQWDTQVPSVLYVCLIVPAIVIACILPWLLILPSYFKCTVKQQFKNAILLSIKLVPQTIVMTVLFLLPILCALLSYESFVNLVPLWILVYFSGTIDLASVVVRIPMKSLCDQMKNSG